MIVLEIVFGVLAGLVAIGFIGYVLLDSGSVVSLGIAVVLGAASASLIYLGVHSVHVRDYAKHAAIARDLREQGFRIPESDIHALDGNKVLGSAVNLALGACVYEFPLTKVNGVWYVTTERRDGNGFQKLTPKSAAGLAQACP